jgi:pyridinium-3,5-biscarboxylic acid mononucleotide synthase
MDESSLRELLQRIQAGEVPIEDGVDQLRDLPFADLGYARVDHHRDLRLGFPEVVLGECKTAAQICGIVTELGKGGRNVLVTRVGEALAGEVFAQPDGAGASLTHHPEAKAMVLRQAPLEDLGRGEVLVVTAGTGDLPVAEEACLTAELMGNRVGRMFDVGVAGIHRVLSQRQRLRSAAVVIVVAGMEGALASVVGGLVPRPVIAVPTSVGYGASFGGVAALLGMLNSCAAGVAVVNIDNGFGAAAMATLINRRES